LQGRNKPLPRFPWESANAKSAKILKDALQDYSNVAEAGIASTSVGIITADPARVESVLAWALWGRCARCGRLTGVLRERAMNILGKATKKSAVPI